MQIQVGYTAGFERIDRFLVLILGFSVLNEESRTLAKGTKGCRGGKNE